MITEEEAKTKWCPESRVGVYAGNGAVSVNRHPETADDTRCIGSACMAWRWKVIDMDGAVSATIGYCGKARYP